MCLYSEEYFSGRIRSIDIAVKRLQSPAVASLQSLHCRHEFDNCRQSGIELFAKGMKTVGRAANRSLRHWTTMFDPAWGPYATSTTMIKRAMTPRVCHRPRLTRFSWRRGETVNFTIGYTPSPFDQ